MPRVKLISVEERFDGLASYDDSCHNLFSKNKKPHAFEKWFFDIETFGITCTDDKQIIEVGGYLPKKHWILNRSIIVPEPTPCRNFVIDESFDASMRNAREEIGLHVEVSSERSVVKVRIKNAIDEDADKVFVSPHDNLIVGATDADPMILTEFILLNVTGVDHL